MITSGRTKARGTYTLPRRLYLDKAGKVVEANDPARQTLLGTAGFTIPAERARELGLLDEPQPEPVQAAPTDEKKAESESESEPKLEAEPKSADPAPHRSFSRPPKS